MVALKPRSKRQSRKKSQSSRGKGATFALDGGSVLIRLNPESAAQLGDVVQLYAEDYFIGSGCIEQHPADGGLWCSVAIELTPAISSPVAIRAVLARLGE